VYQELEHEILARSWDLKQVVECIVHTPREVYPWQMAFGLIVCSLRMMH